MLTIMGTLMRDKGFGMDVSTAYGYDVVHDVHSYDTDKLTIEDRVYIDLDHNGDEIGHLVHIERTEQGDIHLVGVITDCDELADLEGDIFLSPTLWCRQSGHDRVWVGREPHLLSVALTRDPQQICLFPITILRGDLTSEYHRSCWSWDQRKRPLMKRAVEATATFERRRAPLHLVDLRPATIIEPVPTITGPMVLETRSAATGAVHEARRSIEVIAIPHDVETRVAHEGRMIGEVCDRGAFAGSERQGRRIPVNRDHDEQRLVGRVQHLDPFDRRGLIAELRISPTVLGDETLALAADGVLDASVGFTAPGVSWDPGRTRRRITRAVLHHLALTATPAYPTANVLAVARSAR